MELNEDKRTRRNLVLYYILYIIYHIIYLGVLGRNTRA